jgi:hypothetical protein
MNAREWIVAIGIVLVAIVLFVITPVGEAAKKVRLYPYKIVAVTGETGGVYDSVWYPTDNSIAHTIFSGHRGIYDWTYDPAHGDSATNGVDSLGVGNSTGLFYDTLDFYFHILDYDGGWLGYGIANWDSLHGNTDTARVEVTAELGTEMGNNGTFFMLKALATQERGIGAAHVDTITFSSLAEDSLFVLSLKHEVEGGSDVDSTLFLDWLRLRYVICDSALILDQVNDQAMQFRAFMIVKEEY